MSKDVVAGVGVRYAEIFNLDSDGLPSVNVASASPVTGTLLRGIKSFTYDDPEPQRIAHYGEDHTLAQDSLPSTDVGSFVMTAAATNLIVDAMAEATKIATINNMEMRLANSDKRGSEPQLFISVYRQALDIQKGSSTYGKLRQYHAAYIPSVRLSPASQSMEQTATDKTYQGTPTPVTSTPWNQVFDETTWGATQGEYVESTTNYKPRWNFYLGNGTIVAFQLSKPPVSSSDVTVWVDGTLTSPSAVNITTANPAFTLGAAPGVAKKVAALILHNTAD
jgi:hypothetical protein